ncbi:winged helix DNA-binding protein [Nocardia cyriacigeorgica]|uniref:Winged helix DNA-binding protein n=1 Tax=Nocardia cyriacigeorgica TaxID=135487 RepID=A0A5R8PCN1_9NOCA|nr:MarR family transcriptional regulator [Nocardia cyriacigeorgica]TLG05300.1 winged helix DNA-binding protein [Nocardia cyriacigeorgica]
MYISDVVEYVLVTDTIGSADDSDIVEFLGAVTDVRRMISTLTLPVARKRGISERALGIIYLVYAGLDRPSLLVEYLNVLPSTITTDVEKLVAAGLLRRTLSPADRRVTILEVTRKGIATQQQSLRELHAYFRTRAAGVSLEELHSCIATLRKLSGQPQPSIPNPMREPGTTD